MSILEVTSLMQATMVIILKIAGPILLLSLITGLIISIFQAATSINEQTLTFVPKLLVIGIVLLMMSSWIAQVLIDFTRYIFQLMLEFK